MGKTFIQLYKQHKGKISDKWSLYLDEWDRFFMSYKEQSINMLEIGIQNGGALEIFSKYFVNAEKIIGCDIDERCKQLEYDNPRIKVVVGNANSDNCEKKILGYTESLDIIIDDGSHKSSDIIRSFARYFPHLSVGGIYIIEDLHASYWDNFEGGLHNHLSAISFLKRLTDIVNYEHWRNNRAREHLLEKFSLEFDVDFHTGDLARIHSIEFMNSMCVVKKLSPDRNVLGKRRIVGNDESVTDGANKLVNTVIQDAAPIIKENSSYDVFSLMESKETLSIQISEREGQVQSLTTQVSEREGQVQSLTTQVSEREGQVQSLTTQVSEREGQVQSLTTQVSEREQQVQALTTQVFEMDTLLNEIRISKAWRVTVLLRRVRVFFLPPNSWRTKTAKKIIFVFLSPYKKFVYHRRYKHKKIKTRETEVIHTKEVQKAFLFLSGCPGDAQRYRCVHQAEQLSFRGYSYDLAIYGKTDLTTVLDKYRGFIFHRVPYDSDIENFIENARKTGKVVLFDTDDLVFDVDALDDIAALKTMDETEKALYFQGLQRYRKTLINCDGITVSTMQLKEEVAFSRKPVSILPNVISKEMVEIADNALTIDQSSDKGKIVIAYFSGTHTHNDDFLEVADALLWVLEKYTHIYLLIVGYLDLDVQFVKYEEKIERIPLQPWQKLSEILRKVDINLAPLEKDNRFTEAKSCIKYLEAGIMKVPTVASKRKDFIRVIRDGDNGFLADTQEEWKITLQKLIESESLRLEVGQKAYNDVRQNHTTITYAHQFEENLNEVIISAGYKKKKKLTINWILRAPIASRGGGYRTIFRLARYLGNRGHNIRLYIEAIAHLEGLSDLEIVKFTKGNFGPLNAEVYVGHDNILPADATIATNWPTAYTVANHNSSINKFYFVQDYEPEFYDIDDSLYDAAEKTYFLDLQAITIGHYLPIRLKELNGQIAEVIPFNIDANTFYVTSKPEDRKGKLRLLFFARPGVKRRGYELALKALEIVKKQNLELEIAFFGANSKELKNVPFEFTNLGILSPEQLAEEMNQSHMMLSLSLSNISWVPFEGMACGLTVIDADVPSVREMVDDNAICLASPTPEGISNAILRLIDDRNLRLKFANTAIAYIGNHKWEDTCQQLEEILAKRCVL